MTPMDQRKHELLELEQKIINNAIGDQSPVEVFSAIREYHMELHHAMAIIMEQGNKLIMETQTFVHMRMISTIIDRIETRLFNMIKEDPEFIQEYPNFTENWWYPPTKGE